MTALLPHEQIDNLSADLGMQFNAVTAQRDRLTDLCREMFTTLQSIQELSGRRMDYGSDSDAIQAIYKESFDAVTKARGVLKC